MSTANADADTETQNDKGNGGRGQPQYNSTRVNWASLVTVFYLTALRGVRGRTGVGMWATVEGGVVTLVPKIKIKISFPFSSAAYSSIVHRTHTLAYQYGTAGEPHLVFPPSESPGTSRHPRALPSAAQASPSAAQACRCVASGRQRRMRGSGQGSYDPMRMCSSEWPRRPSSLALAGAHPSTLVEWRTSEEWVRDRGHRTPRRRHGRDPSRRCSAGAVGRRMGLCMNLLRGQQSS